MTTVTIKLMDIVGRVSYHCDIMFRVIDIREHDGKKMAVLYGEDIRLIADAPYEDLIIMSQSDQRRIMQEFRTLEEQSLELFRQDVHLLQEKREYTVTEGYSKAANYFQLPGKVLHLDGDPGYLKKCLTVYEKIGIPVTGLHLSEKDMPRVIGELVDYYRPDILVITGHDAYTKAKGSKADIEAYRHSKHFVQTVKEARKKVPHLDQLVIFAGACQSHFESLIHAGANFASSPSRVNIHALDPVYIVSKISFTPYNEHIRVWDVLRNTLSGERGLGGVETKGVLRTGMPFHYEEEEEQSIDPFGSF